MFPSVLVKKYIFMFSFVAKLIKSRLISTSLTPKCYFNSSRSLCSLFVMNLRFQAEWRKRVNIQKGHNESALKEFGWLPPTCWRTVWRTSLVSKIIVFPVLQDVFICGRCFVIKNSLNVIIDFEQGRLRLCCLICHLLKSFVECCR